MKREWITINSSILFFRNYIFLSSPFIFIISPSHYILSYISIENLHFRTSILFIKDIYHNIRCKSNGTKCRPLYFFIAAVVERNFWYRSIGNLLLFRPVYCLLLSNIYIRNSKGRKTHIFKTIPHFSCILK